MENQHRKIKGYRELSQEEIDLMNEIKTMGAELQALTNKVLQVNHSLKLTDEGKELLEVSEADRWTHIARTDIQKGIMSLTRAVAKPTFF